MTVNNWLLVIGLTSILSACQNHTTPKNADKNNQQPTTIQSQKMSVDELLNLMVQHDWQFEKGENLIDENLKSLDGEITLNFAKSTKRSEMHDPNYDLNYQYHFSVDAGCNHNSNIIGFDKSINKVVGIRTISISTMVGCSPDHEKTIRNFITNDNISYQVDENQLLFKDDNNQTLFFKKKPHP